jgi:hypothetical protein
MEGLLKGQVRRRGPERRRGRRAARRAARVARAVRGSRQAGRGAPPRARPRAVPPTAPAAGGRPLLRSADDRAGEAAGRPRGPPARSPSAPRRHGLTPAGGRAPTRPRPRPRPLPQVARLPPRNVRNDNFLQRLFVTWVYAVIDAGRRGALQQDALRMPADQATEAAAGRFLKEWAAETGAAAAACKADAGSGAAGGSGGGCAGRGARAPRGASLWRALWRAFGGQFVAAGVFKLLWSTFVLLGASYFVNALIEFVQGKMAGGDALPGKGVGWVSAACCRRGLR